MKAGLLKHIRKHYEIYSYSQKLEVFYRKDKMHFGTFNNIRALALNVISSDYGLWSWSDATKKNNIRKSKLLMAKMHTKLA